MGCNCAKQTHSSVTPEGHKSSSHPDRDHTVNFHKQIPNYPNLTTHNNLLAKHLSPEIWKQLERKKSGSGFTFDKLIQIGIDNKNPSSCSVGVTVGDEESYTVFSELLDPIIEEWHNGYSARSTHHSYTDVDKITERVELDSDYVLSCRVCVARSLRGYSYPTHCTRAERRQVQHILLTALQGLDGSYKGQYYPVGSIPSVLKLQMEHDTMLCDKVTCPVLKSSGVTREWPDCRGVWVSSDHRLIVWINDKEHIRFIWREAGGKLYKAFHHVYKAVKQVENTLEQDGFSFQHNSHHGYMLGCPTEIGTGMCAELHMRLPHFKGDPNKQNALEYFRLKERCNCMPDIIDDEVVGEDLTMFVSNKDTIGRTEIELLQHVMEGAEKLIAIDKDLYTQNYSLNSDVDYSSYLVSLANPTENLPDITNHNNWLADCLMPEIYWKLVGHNTESGFSFDQCIQTGVDNPTHGLDKQIGIVAGDEDTYNIFSDLTDRIIEKTHPGYNISEESKHKTNSAAENTSFSNSKVKLDKKYVQWCRIETSRNVRGFCLSPHCSRGERRAVEELVIDVLDGESEWSYLPLNKITDKEEETFSATDMLLTKPSSLYYTSAGICRDWPQNRGMFYNSDKTIVVHINGINHLHFMSHSEAVKIDSLYTKLMTAVHRVQSLIEEAGEELMLSPQLGYITTCPRDLGTGMTISVKIKLRSLSKHPLFTQILKDLFLQQDGMMEEGDYCTLKKVSHLGVSEIEQIQEFIENLSLLIKMDKQCEKNKPIDELLPPSTEEKTVFEKGDIQMSDYPNFEFCNSLLAESDVLTEKLYNKLKTMKTSLGISLDDCIEFGLDTYHLKDSLQLGLVAGDAECYTLFTEVFQPVLAKIHYATSYQPLKKHISLLAPKKLNIDITELDPEYVRSCRATAVRCIQPYRFVPAIGRQERREVEAVVLNAVSTLGGDFTGKYITKAEHPNEWQCIPWCASKPFWKYSSTRMTTRDWPDGRGVWINHDQTFCVLINLEEHFKIVCRRKDTDMPAAFSDFCDAMQKLETSIKKQNHDFARDKNFGFLQSDIRDIGTAFHAGMDVRLRFLQEHVLYDDILNDLCLLSDHCDDTELISNGFLHVYNSDVWGLSEVDIVRVVVNGVITLMQLEKKLENNESIESFFSNDLD